MSQDLAAGRPSTAAAEHAAARRARRGPRRRRLGFGAAARVKALWDSRPLAWRLCTIALLGAVAAAGVGYTTSANAAASPPHVAVELRVGMILALICAGMYAQTSRLQARMGGLLIGAGFLSSLWLLNGSSNRWLFSIGVVCAGAAPTLFAFLMLAHPTGRLFSRREVRFLWLTGGALATLWLLSVLMTVQPPLKTPLLQCTPHCPPNVFSIGSATDAVGVVQAAMRVAWLALSVGTPLLLVSRARASPAPVRRSLIPVVVIAAAVPVLQTAYVISLALRGGHTATLGGLYVGMSLVIPLAILAGLARERLFMGQTLADFVNELARMPRTDAQALMAAALRDPSLTIAYRRPGLDAYVDANGAPLPEFPPDQAVAWIERGGSPVAAVVYSPDLSRDARFVQAAGAAAMIRLETTQLQADLKASASDLAASRARLIEMAHAERRRLERDLHDGVQQHLVGLRIKLAMATDALKEDPAQGERVLALVGKQMDELLSEVRSLARGIYPSLLTERGLAEALRAAARNSPTVPDVRGRVRRYPQEIEVAVYFCCLEALQNVTKHAGAGAAATVTLWEDEQELRFDVRDTGVGFNRRSVRPGSGLINMRDRIEAVGGQVEVSSRRGRGTLVRGSVPTGPFGPAPATDAGLSD